MRQLTCLGPKSYITLKTIKLFGCIHPTINSDIYGLEAAEDIGSYFCDQVAWEMQDMSELLEAVAEVVAELELEL